MFAVGDVTSVGTPKAGMFAEGQAAIAADHIAALVRDENTPARYDGRGICYLEFGHEQVARVDVTFLAGRPQSGDIEGPSRAIAAYKADFGASRARRWFGSR